jgi:SpoIID/LytB domain protein
VKNNRTGFPARSSRRGLAAGLVVFSLVICGLVFAPTAHGADNDFVFTGRGWGHGTGMSQWGAWQAAREGVSFEGILAFYYPGTTLESLPDPDTEVRVRISANPPSSSVTSFIQVDLKPTVTPALLVKHTAAGDETETIPEGTFINIVNEGGRVQVVTDAGKQGPFDYVELQPIASDSGAGEGRVAVQFKTEAKIYDYREFWGSMRVQYGDGPGDLWAYNIVKLDKYVRSIAEVDYDWAMPSHPSSYAPEAVKAQAVAARSYAAAKDGPLTDGWQDQYYRGYDFEKQYPGIAQAADDTTGLILTYQGQPASTYFSAHSGGYTTDSAWSGTKPPYIVSQPDPWSLKAPPAGMSSAGPGYNWTYAISKADLSAEYDVGTISRVEIVERDTADSGSHAKTLRLTGDKGTATVSAVSLKSRLGLRSTLILSVTGGEPLAPGEFYDVGSGHVYHDQIARMVTDGLMNGYDSGLFKPENPVARWQFAKIAVNLHNLLNPADQIAVENVSTAPFADIPLSRGTTGDISDWVAAAKKAGLVKGESSTRFDPYSVVRRDQMATMMCRALGWEDEAATLAAGAPSFTDLVPTNVHWGPATYLKLQGVIQGYSDGTLRPGEATKRQHVAVILCRVLDMGQ